MCILAQESTEVPTRGLPGGPAKAAGLAVLFFADAATLEKAMSAWADKRIDGRRLMLSRDAFLATDLEADVSASNAAARESAT